MRRGFTLIEILVTVSIIAVLAAIVTVATSGALLKARDAKRKFEIAQMGRLISSSCYQPDAGPGIYDLAQIIPEVLTKNAQYAKFITKVPRDPKRGSDTETFYRYRLSEDGMTCAIYANLENDKEKIAITAFDEPGEGRGTGVLQSATVGWNGTNLFFQVSN